MTDLNPDYLMHELTKEVEEKWQYRSTLKEFEEWLDLEIEIGRNEGYNDAMIKVKEKLKAIRRKYAS